ncbi:MAG: NUDIX hydrolase N-terminal domain-containing protein [Chloroflexi bacterium]|nr:NUDIX hydrolase N-terminal domain-containing protein [Chloroflexota bacterium]
MTDILLLLDQIRAIASTGLHYAQNPYDQERYQHLLHLAALEYSALTGLTEAQVIARFRQELGYITPKVGVDAAIFDAQGRILLCKRSDDSTWCLPCGWAEVGLTPEENIAREVREETGLEVRVGQLIQVMAFFPHSGGGPHAGYGLIYHCVPVGGALRPSHETPQLAYHDYTQVADWHFDHRQRAAAAFEFWRRIQQGESGNA